MKKKNFGMIPIQTTAVARRQFKLRGRTLAFQGRPRIGVPKTRQRDDTDSSGVRHKLPARKRKAGASHSLNEAVVLNKRATKKH